VKWRS